MDVRHDWELPYAERCVLDAIVRSRRPAVMFEFGTFRGATTRLLAEAAPDAVVHTLDLTAEGLKEIGLDDYVGADLVGRP